MQIPIELESKAVNNWSVDDVSTWLSHNSIPQDCVNIIKGEEIDGMSITALDIPALKEIGLNRFGPRVNTFNLINALIDHGKRDQAARDNVAPMLTSPASSTKLTFSPHDSTQISKIQNSNHLTEDTPPGLAHSAHSTSNQYTEQFQNMVAPVENINSSNLVTTFSRLENSEEQQNLPQHQEHSYPWSSQIDDSNNASQSLKLHEEIAPANYNGDIHSFHSNQTSDTTYQVLQAQKLLGVTLNDESNQQNDIEFQQASPSPSTSGFSLSNRYKNEIFEGSADVSNDKYNRKYSYSREESPEPYRDYYRSEDRKRAPSDSYYNSKSTERPSSRRRGRYTEAVEYSSPESERKPVQSFKFSKFKDQSAYPSHKNYYEYNNYNRSSSYRDRSADYSNDNRYNRDGEYDKRTFKRSDNYKDSRSTFSKPQFIDNNYKSTAAPPLGPPKRESQIFTPFANYSNTPITIKPLAVELYPQQIEGVESLWKTVIENLSGDTLSPCKGLGKTGQVFTFLNTLRYYVRYSPDIIPDMLLSFKILIVTPRFLKENWLNGFQTCVNFEPYLKNQYVHLAIPNCLDEFHHKQRLRALQNWDKHGGIMIVSHNLINEYIQATNYFDKQSRGLIFDQPGASLVFIDETRDLYEENSNFTPLDDKFNTQCLVYLDGF